MIDRALSAAQAAENFHRIFLYAITFTTSRAGIYFDRVIGRHRHHWRAGVDVVAGAGFGEEEGAPDEVRVESEAALLGASDLCGGLQRGVFVREFRGQCAAGHGPNDVVQVAPALRGHDEHVCVSGRAGLDAEVREFAVSAGLRRELAHHLAQCQRACDASLGR